MYFNDALKFFFRKEDFKNFQKDACVRRKIKEETKVLFVKINQSTYFNEKRSIPRSH